MKFQTTSTGALSLYSVTEATVFTYCHDQNKLCWRTLPWQNTLAIAQTEAAWWCDLLD